MLSTHRVEVVPVVLEAHPNADTLSVVHVWGYIAVVRTADWQGVPLGAYIPPDSIVPATPAFAFLGEHRRIKARRFRGVMSQGLLIPAPEGSRVGDDVAGLLGIVHYIPPEPMSTGGEDEPEPFCTPRYDVDSGFRFADCFVPGEPVVATEKIHGTNASFTWFQDRLWTRSHSTWKKPPAPGERANVWWKAVEQNPWITEWCRKRPGMVLCAEVFGPVQDLKYGTARGEFRVLAFDVRRQDGTFLDVAEFRMEVPASCRVPVVYEGPFDLERMRELCNGPSRVPGADHLREGIVVGPVSERWDERMGRVKAKFVSPDYLERAK